MANANASENINVMVRLRPVNDIEAEASKFKCAARPLPDGRSIEMVDPSLSSHFTFTYNRVFAPAASQPEVYESIGPAVLEAVTNGINAAVIAYGQTGSGKTHTMFGHGHDEEAGIVPRLLGALFRRVASPDMDKFYKASVTFIQIYRENILDLLTTEVRHCLIREDRKVGLWITDAETLGVDTAEDALRIMAIGDRRRVVASTMANAESSRSHTVFIVTLLVRHTFECKESASQLYLVDLAGSECVAKTGSEGTRLEEAKYINTSLLALRNVISALVTGKPHIPYRDSKITRLLQNSFGGNAKTFLVVCCSPSVHNARETLASLRFGDSSRQIQNRPTQNVRRSAEELNQLLAQTTRDIADSKRRIEELTQILVIQLAELESGTRPGKASKTQAPVPGHFICPLSKKVMQNPVIAMDGCTYDEKALCKYFTERGCVPGGSSTDLRYLPDHSLKLEWQDYAEANGLL